MARASDCRLKVRYIIHHQAVPYDNIACLIFSTPDGLLLPDVQSVSDDSVGYE